MPFDTIRPKDDAKQDDGSMMGMLARRAQLLKEYGSAIVGAEKKERSPDLESWQETADEIAKRTRRSK